MNRYSLPQVIWLSFYSAPMYRAVAQQWRVRSLAYLFIVLILCWTPVLVRLHKGIELAMDTVRANVLSQIPTLTFDKGTLRTPEARPYVMEVNESGMHLRFVIDTTGRYKTLEEANAIVLITAKQAFVHSNAAETRTYDFTRVKDATYDQKTFSSWLDRFMRWIPKLLYPAIFFLSFFKRIVQALLVGLIGIMISRAVEAKLSYPELFTLAVVSMTPSMILGSALSAAGAHFPLQWLLLGAVGFGYFLFAINAASDTLPDDDEA